MPDGKDGVIKQHPRSGKPHHLPDLLAHFRFVAMDSAVAAESLILHKRAFLAAQSGIVKEHLTVRTQLILLSGSSFMILSAIQTDHFTRHVLFFSPLFIDIFHLFRLRYIGLACRNRVYLCKEIHVFEQDQKKDKRPAIHILHCQECQNQHTGSRNEQAEFCL